MLGVKFDDIHSYYDLGLYLFEKEIGAPEIKVNKVELTGADGDIDLSNAISGRPVFKNRILSFKFGVLNPKEKWATINSKILNTLHGKRMKVIIDDDKTYFYIGSISVNTWKSSKTHGEFVIECDVEPYKYSIVESDEDWLWNPFSFIDGIAQTTRYTVAGTRKAVILTNSENIPEFISDCNLEIQFEGKTYNMTAGIKKFYDLKLHAGKNEITFIGNGNVKVVYREKKL